jgi:hypothetical protein
VVLVLSIVYLFELEINPFAGEYWTSPRHISTARTSPE